MASRETERDQAGRNFFEIKGLPASGNQYIIHAIESTDG